LVRVLREITEKAIAGDPEAAQGRHGDGTDGADGTP